MMLLACLASTVVGLLTGVIGSALLRRTETERIASARAELTRQWRLLEQIWTQLDPATRLRVHISLTYWQKVVLLSQLAIAAVRTERSQTRVA